MGGCLLLVARPLAASSLQSSCPPPRGFRGALLPMAELQQKQPALCLLLSFGRGRGKACSLPCSPHLWAGDSISDRSQGAESGAGKCLVGGEENSAVALAKEQKNPPSLLLCSCCRQSCPASSCFNHWVTALSYMQFCYPNVLSGHIVLISVNSLHPTSIICLRASLNYASNHSDFREDTVTLFFFFNLVAEMTSL